MLISTKSARDVTMMKTKRSSSCHSTFRGLSDRYLQYSCHKSLLVISIMSSGASSFPFPQAKHFVSKENYQNYFDAEIPPVVKVLPGELIHLETNDCFHGKIRPNVSNPLEVLSGLARNQMNPITGPIYVEGAMPGDFLAVKLLDIRPKGVGVACCSPHSGQLCSWIPDTAVKFFDLSSDGKMVTMRDVMKKSSNGEKQLQKYHPRIGPIVFPSSPMLGVIGVAPAGMDPVVTMPAGKHGGNLDNNRNGIGAIIYIRVNHPGGLLSMGDMHASQGDGEIAGNGVEIGGDVLFQCEIMKEEDIYRYDGPGTFLQDGTGEIDNLTLEYPVTETETHWITHGVVVENIPETTKIACQEAAKVLIGQWGFTPEEAFIFLSVKGDLGLCQSCHPDRGTQIAKMTVPKLPVCPRPFRTLQNR